MFIRLRKMLLMMKICDNPWAVTQSNWTCQSQMMYANAQERILLKNISLKKYDAERQNIFHVIVYYKVIHKHNVYSFAKDVLDGKDFC